MRPEESTLSDQPRALLIDEHFSFSAIARKAAAAASGAPGQVWVSVS